MSIENTERVMHAYHDAWERGDQEAGTGFFADNLVVHMGGGGPLAGVYKSRQDFLTNWVGRVAAYTDTWDVLGNETLLVGEDGILLLVRERWSKGSASVETQRMGLYRVEGDQIVECRFADMNQPEVDEFFSGIGSEPTAAR